MVETVLQSPTNPHFFQPLLPGFISHLSIPVTFYSKYLQGRTNNKKVKLRSEASDKNWEVEIDNGMRIFTRGWSEFAKAHDFRIGDVIVFRHEGDFVFHVTAFGPSFCEIKYTNEIKPEMKTKKKEYSCSYFVAKVTPSSLRKDTLYLPRSFVDSNGLNINCCEMGLKNGKGRTWNSPLRHSKLHNVTYITQGWKNFCRVNGLKARDHFKFKLVRIEGKPFLSLCPVESNARRVVERSEEEDTDVESLSTDSSSGDESSDTEESQEKSVKEENEEDCWGSSSLSQNRFVTLTVTPHSIRSNKLRLPVSFTRPNGIYKPGRIVLVGKDGVRWMVHLAKDDHKCGRMRLGRDWKGFCDVNGVKIGESFVFELIWENDATPVLKMISKK